MSTIKVTDLKLHLNQNNADTVGAAESHRVFGDDQVETLRVENKEMNELLQEFYVRENDSKLLLWAST